MINNSWMLLIKGLIGLKDIIKLHKYHSPFLPQFGSRKPASKPQSIYTPLQGVKRPF